MYVKDGAAMRVITLQRALCQNLDKEEKNCLKSKEKEIVENEIS